MDSSNRRDVGRYVTDPSNDRQMKQIVANARRWCQTNMRHDKLIQYVLDALSYYVDMLDLGDSTAAAATTATTTTTPVATHNGSSVTWTDAWTKLQYDKSSLFDWKPLPIV
jgi:hypothetical protein